MFQHCAVSSNGFGCKRRESPDLHPVQQLWDKLQHRVRPYHSHHKPTSLMLSGLEGGKSPQNSIVKMPQKSGAAHYMVLGLDIIP